MEIEDECENGRWRLGRNGVEKKKGGENRKKIGASMNGDGVDAQNVLGF